MMKLKIMMPKMKECNECRNASEGKRKGKMEHGNDCENQDKTPKVLRFLVTKVSILIHVIV